MKQKIVIAPQNATASEPLLKWPGGKRRLLSQIIPLISRPTNHYFEPFLGGAALFFHLQPTTATLSDKNAELINCYVQVRDHPDAVIARLSQMENTEKNYYAVRESVPRSNLGRAARFIFLTTLAFNGIYRVNQRGQFNVPYGKKTHINPCEPEKIKRISLLLASANLTASDFEEAVKPARAGDLIYFDPPYTVAHGNNGFLKYNEKILQWEDQVRLASLATKMAKRGCEVLVSNADHPSVLELYRGFKVKRIRRPSIMAASSSFRRPITECVFYT